MQMQIQTHGSEFIAQCRLKRRALQNTGKVKLPSEMAYLPAQQLPESWTWASLSDVCERVSVGHVGPTTQYFEDGPGNPLLIRSQNVRPGFLDLADCATITEDFHQQLKKSQLRAGDILIVRVGANRGDVAVVPEISRSMNCANVIFARPLFGGLFFAYYLNSKAGRDALIALTTGSAQGVLNTEDVARLPVPVPPRHIQESIASCLGAYDDLILANRRRIALLEDMARRLFEEWFVYLRFPGHKDHAMVETQEGSQPLGWVSQKVGDTFEIVGGGTPSKAEPNYWEHGTIDWYTPSDLTGSKTSFMDSSSLKITEDGLRRSSAQMFPAFSIMMTSRATIGAISINTADATTNQGFITCIPNDRVPLCFLTEWLRSKVPTFLAHATGATFKEIAKGVFRQLSIVVPPISLTAEYEKRARPIMDMALTLERSQRNLISSRDLLLPRLIFGDLSVAVAGPELEAVA